MPDPSANKLPAMRAQQGQTKPPTDAVATTRLPIYTIVVAIVVSLSWLAASGFMFHAFVHPDKPEAWDHAMVLYNALSSVAYTAIGVLLGAQIQQVNLAGARLEAAEARNVAGEATRDANQARKDADKQKTVVRDALKDALIPNDIGGGRAKSADEQLLAIQNKLKTLL